MHFLFLLSHSCYFWKFCYIHIHYLDKLIIDTRIKILYLCKTRVSSTELESKNAKKGQIKMKLKIIEDLKFLRVLSTTAKIIFSRNFSFRKNIPGLSITLSFFRNFSYIYNNDIPTFSIIYLLFQELFLQ